MRLELGAREVIVERCEELLASLEASIRAEHSSKLEEDARTLQVALAGVHEFSSISETLELFLKAIVALEKVDSKSGGLLLQVVGTLGQALIHLGTDSRAAQMLPKILINLNRLLAKYSQAPRAAESMADRYAVLFLRDEDEVLPKIMELAQSLTDTRALDELFRLVHTVKGNAMAVGLDELGKNAHLFEDLLVVLKEEYAGGSFSSQLRLHVHELADRLHAVFEKAQVSAGLKAAATAQRKSSFYLSTALQGRSVLIPSAIVESVLFKPAIMSVPGGHEEWAGLVKAANGFVPVLREESAQGASSWYALINTGEARFCLALDDAGLVNERPTGQKSDSTEILDFIIRDVDQTDARVPKTG